ncbi:hypothetical protein DFQ26_002063 [Actinomortierella ambigua]|nr:hypothetical protein DFQ26_002063 [Actinomortierella ambigua]
MTILPLRSHPIFAQECFSASQAHPRRAAKLLAENEEPSSNRKMIIGLYELDPSTDEWRHHTGDIFEHVWTGDWADWDRQFQMLFSHDASILYVATRDDDTLYALDATNHLDILAKVSLPFRPKCYTLSLTRTDSDSDDSFPSSPALVPSASVYITSVCPWLISVYEPLTLRHLGTVSSGRCDVSQLDPDDHPEVFALLTPAATITHRTIHVDGGLEGRDIVVIDHDDRHRRLLHPTVVSHFRACRLSRHVDLIYSWDCGEYPWLIDLTTLRTVRLDLDPDQGSNMEVESVEPKEKVIFRTAIWRFEVAWSLLANCLDSEGHLAEDAPSILTIRGITFVFNPPYFKRDAKKTERCREVEGENTCRSGDSGQRTHVDTPSSAVQGPDPALSQGNRGSSSHAEGRDNKEQPPTGGHPGDDDDDEEEEARLDVELEKKRVLMTELIAVNALLPYVDQYLGDGHPGGEGSDEEDYDIDDWNYDFEYEDDFVEATFVL